ncbi:hypothetical protein PT974_00277 [Cladobotryum mycophilum]|uniref:Nephrocystin 3-like N-terminal domain-containing protein n=1 Tax=Cladobotryum mycophilum TaxID=491253 RepID=A0ABR0T1L6_9HYPO
MHESSKEAGSEMKTKSVSSVSLSNDHGPSESRSASRWEDALQRLCDEDREQFELAQKGIDDPKSVLANVLAASTKRKEECMKNSAEVGHRGTNNDFIINDIEVFGHVLSSLENISNLIAQCQIIEVLYLAKKRKKSGELYGQLSGSITDLYAAILGYLAEVMHYYGLNTALADLAQAQDLDTAVNEIQSIEKHLKNKDDRDQIELQSLKDTMKGLREPIDRIDTRLWEIQDGANQQRSSSSVLWLHGITGSGKTKLASMVVDKIKHKERTTADDCVEVLLQLVDEYPAVTFVLDALDEVDQEDRQELLDILSRILQESNSLIRVFISNISTFIDKQLTSAKTIIWKTHAESAGRNYSHASRGSQRNWLLYAQESISIQALAVLAGTRLASEPEASFSGDEVPDVCSNLIVIRQNSFDFAYLSVREFFERLQNRDVHAYLPEPGHVAIAAACLQYLNLALVKNKGIYLRETVMKALESRSKDEDGDEQANKEDNNMPQKHDENHENEKTDPKTATKAMKWFTRMKGVSKLREMSYEIFAIVSSDHADHQPSGYAATWVVYHIEKSKQRRLESPLADLIKIFILERSSELGGSTYRVERSFRAWCVLMSKSR